MSPEPTTAIFAVGGERVSPIELFVLLGAVAWILVQSSWAPAERRSDRTWSALVAWSVAVAIVLIGRILQWTSTSDTALALGVRLQVFSAPVIVVTGIVFLARLANPSAMRRILLAATTSLIGLGIVVFLTPWVVPSIRSELVTVFGTRVPTAKPGPLWFVLVLFTLSASVLAVRQLRRSPVGLFTSRPLVRLAVGATIAGFANDTLFAAELIPSTPLVHFPLTALGFVMYYAIDRRDALARATLVTALGSDASRFRSLSEVAFEGVVVHANGLITGTNPAAQRMFGVEEKGLIGKLVFSKIEGIGPEDLKALVEDPEHVLETRGTRADGGTFPVQVRARNVVTDEGRASVLVFRDMTEEAQLRARVLMTDRLASLGTLAAGAAHEINNPLQYVQGNVRLVMDVLESDQVLDAKARASALGSLEEALEGCGRISRIVRDLGALSRGDEASPKPTDIKEALETALRTTTHEVRHRAVLVREFEDVPAVVGIRNRLIQVFVNLIVNAVQALPDGAMNTQRVFVRLRREESRVIAEIEDTGPGIPLAVRERMFDPFFSGRAGQGSGLGLSISYNLLRSMGGTITYADGSRGGALFRVELQASHVEVAEPTASVPRTTAATSGRSILVVDDEPAVGKLFPRLLFGYEVDVVDSGRAAIEACMRKDYDVILCDITMPDVSGMDVHAALLADRPVLADRMVFVTGGGASERATAFLEEHADRRVDKPVNREVLRRVVSRMISAPERPSIVDLGEPPIESDHI